VLFFSLLFSFFIFGGYFITKEIVNPDAQVEKLQSQNRDLMRRLDSYIAKFEKFESEIDLLNETNNTLRLAANLEPLDEEERTVGTGGALFDEIIPSSSEELSRVVSQLDTYVDKIDFKINIEKNTYEEIKKNFELNNKLYDAIPAVKPSEGYFGDRFGMRLHPILKLRRMHHGLDIVTNIGTPVYAPGGGKVKYIGRKGGYGLTLILDHGFGYTTLYSHLSKVEIKRGQTVERGDLIARTGNSGKLSTGPHLHYEVRHNGIALNPKNFIYDDVSLFEIIAQND
jgi:murein DD-endopeptidase MepM/ murein hydrolase activator NlpD